MGVNEEQIGVVELSNTKIRSCAVDVRAIVRKDISGIFEFCRGEVIIVAEVVVLNICFTIILSYFACWLVFILLVSCVNNMSCCKYGYDGST